MNKKNPENILSDAQDVIAHVLSQQDRSISNTLFTTLLQRLETASMRMAEFTNANPDETPPASWDLTREKLAVVRRDFMKAHPIVWTPENITSEQIKSFGSAIIGSHLNTYPALRAQIREKATAAAHNDDELRQVLQEAKTAHAQLSAWNDRFDLSATHDLRVLEAGLGADADAITEALRHEPEQRSANWWRHQE